MPDPIPVIQCDLCGRITPGRLSGTKFAPTSDGATRHAELRVQGWLISQDRDLCPPCYELHELTGD